MVVAGDVLVVDLTGITGDFLPRSAPDVRADVIRILTAYFTVNDVAITRSGFIGDPLHVLSKWPYTAVVTVTLRDAYGDAEDVASVIANAFYQAAGELPTASVRGRGPQQSGGVTYTGPSVLATLGVSGLVLAVVAIAVLAIVVKVR